MKASPFKTVGLLALIQFSNTLDFMMVMPLGPDFVLALQIDPSRLPWISGSYTIAGGLIGILGSFFLDRFERKKALIVSLLGLALATIWGGFAGSLGELLASRVLAGLFGGPATALAFAIVTDVTPVEMRGRAMGILISSFS
ncbi:MAG: MFS transporter, partial [Bdellovibrionota bacterium]